MTVSETSLSDYLVYYVYFNSPEFFELKPPDVRQRRM